MRIPVWETTKIKISGKTIFQYPVDRFNEDEKNGIEAIAFF